MACHGCHLVGWSVFLRWLGKLFVSSCWWIELFKIWTSVNMCLICWSSRQKIHTNSWDNWLPLTPTRDWNCWWKQTVPILCMCFCGLFHYKQIKIINMTIKFWMFDMVLPCLAHVLDISGPIRFPDVRSCWCLWCQSTALGGSEALRQGFEPKHGDGRI